jgi:hypothetical protein
MTLRTPIPLTLRRRGAVLNGGGEVGLRRRSFETIDLRRDDAVRDTISRRAEPIQAGRRIPDTEITSMNSSGAGRGDFYESAQPVSLAARRS